ncbi:MAG: hypothetical protein ACRBDL_00445 [Alphaproteobacteria bacterium]
MSAAFDIFKKIATHTKISDIRNTGNHAKRLKEEEQHETSALRELEKFLESPESIGLDNVKESLRNTIQLMWELKGYTTGYALQHLMHEDHSSLAMDGTLRGDAKKKQRIRDFWEWLEEIAREMALSFAQIYEYTQELIVDIKEEVNDKIEDIDQEIEKIAETEEQARKMKANNKKRRQLVSFKKHLKEHEQELEEADTTEELLNVQHEIIEDLHDLDEGTFDPNKPSPPPVLQPLSDLVAKTMASNDHSYDHDNRDTSTSGSGDSAGDTTEDSSSTDSGETDGKKEEDTKPDLPSIDL